MSVYYKFYRSIFGYSQIEVKGEKEKLLNVLTKKDVEFWGSEVTENNSLLLHGSVLSAGKIVKEAEALGCEIEILKRKGLPFLFNKYKTRYGIFIGIFIAWSLIFFTSLFIWEVKVNEESEEEKAKIVSLLEKQGLQLGSFLPNIDVRQLENEFLMNNNEYSSLAINIIGTVAYIEVRHSVDSGQIEKSDSLCNVVATKSGTITSVEAYGGAPVVKVGDTVSEGDLLISAYMQGRLGVWRGVHACGKVTAAVYYDFEREIPLNSTTTVNTGEKETKVSIQLFSLKADLFFDEESSFDRCIAKSTKEQLTIFGIKLPIIIEKTTYYQQTTTHVDLTEKEAKTKGEKEFSLWKEREITGEILSCKIWGFFNKEKNTYTLKGTVSVLEDIGEEREIENIYQK